MMRALVVLFLLCGVAQAQDYPNRAIRIYVPAAPGGTTQSSNSLPSRSPALRTAKREGSSPRVLMR